MEIGRLKYAVGRKSVKMGCRGLQSVGRGRLKCVVGWKIVGRKGMEVGRLKYAVGWKSVWLGWRGWQNVGRHGLRLGRRA